MAGNETSDAVQVGDGAHALSSRRGDVLKLTLKKKWFDIMCTGEKDEEFRSMGKWILSRFGLFFWSF